MTRSVLCLTVVLLMVACEDATGPNDTATVPSPSAAGAIAAGSFSADVVLSGNLATIGSPIAYTMDFGRRFSSISRVSYFFTFGNDPLDPDDCLMIFPNRGLGGYGFCNPGTTAQTSRTLDFPCTTHAAECDHFRDGVSGGQFRVESRLVGNNPVSVSLRSVTVRIDGVASSTFPSNSWTVRAPMPENLWRYALAAGVVDNPAGQSTVYVFGGRYYQTPTDPPATTILAYDVATDSWTTKAAHFSGGATNGVGRIGDKLYISGGWDFSGMPDHWVDESSSLFAYDWVHDRVIRKADMPQPSGGGVTGVINGKLYVLAGECFQQHCRDFYRYDPATNAWTTLPSAPNFHWQGAGVVLNGKFYVAGGGPSPRRSFDVYDPATNTWTALGLMPPRKPIAVGATAQGKVYVIGIGGDDRKEGVDRNTVAYYPPTNSWANKAPFPGPQGEGGQFLLHPAAALRVLLDGRASILTVGSGHFYSDNTVKPAGTIDPAPPYIYTP